MDQEEILAEWRKHSDHIHELAALCQADPTQAPLHDVQPLPNYGEDKPVFGIQALKRPYNEKAAWLRGAAKAVLPPEFKWEVKEMVGGNCALILLGWETRPDPGGMF